MNEQVVFSPLARFDNEKGRVSHGMKKSDEEYVGFGEAYFSMILQGQTKGWKRHNQMTMNLVVPVGDVRFHVHDSYICSTRIYDIGDQNYGRLTVPPGFWVAFSGLGDGPNVVFNLASLEHDPTEVDTVPLLDFSLHENQ